MSSLLEGTLYFPLPRPFAGRHSSYLKHFTCIIWQPCSTNRRELDIRLVLHGIVQHRHLSIYSNRHLAAQTVREVRKKHEVTLPIPTGSYLVSFAHLPNSASKGENKRRDFNSIMAEPRNTI